MSVRWTRKTLFFLALLPGVSTLSFAQQQVSSLPKSLEGQWTFTATCKGVEHWWQVQLAADGSVRFTQQASPRPHPTQPSTTGSMQTGVDPWRAQWDDAHQRLLIQPRSLLREPWQIVLVPPLMGAKAAQRQGLWAGAVVRPDLTEPPAQKQRQPLGDAGCSTLLASPTLSIKEVDALLPGHLDPRQMGAAPGLFSALERAIKPLPKQACQGHIEAWVQRYLKSTGGRRDPVTTPGVQRLVAQQFEPDLIQSTFGYKLEDLSIKDGLGLSYLLGQSARCQGMPLAAEAAVAPLSKPLLDEGPLSRRQLALLQWTLPVIDSWVQQQFEVLRRQENLSAFDLDLSAVERFVDAAKSLEGWTPQLSDFTVVQRMHTLKYQAIAAAQLKSYQQRIDNAENNFDELAELANALARPVDEKNQPLHAKVSEALQAKVSRQFDSAFQDKTAREDGLSGYRWLRAWPQGYEHLLTRVNPTQKQNAQATVRTRLSQISQARLAKERSHYVQTVLGLPPGAKALIAGKQFDQDWLQESAEIINAPERTAFDQERASRRQRDLKAAMPELTAAIMQLPHYSALKKLRDIHLSTSDESSHEGKAILSAIENRLSAISPWSNLPAGEYLNAIYGGDSERIDELDQAFRAPFIRMMMPVINQFRPFGDALASGAGLAISPADLMLKQYERATLMRMVMAVYLVEFEGRMKPCLEGNPAKFKITHSSSTVYRDGYGSYLYEVRHPDQVEYLLVNQRFSDAFGKVGLIRPDDSPTSRMFEQVFKPKDQGSLLKTDVIAGTRKMMELLVEAGCTSPLTKTMEDNMLAIGMPRM